MDMASNHGLCHLTGNIALIRSYAIYCKSLQELQCAAYYNLDQFSILDTARSPFYLKFARSQLAYIRVRRPNL